MVADTCRKTWERKFLQVLFIDKKRILLVAGTLQNISMLERKRQILILIFWGFPINQIANSHFQYKLNVCVFFWGLGVLTTVYIVQWKWLKLASSNPCGWLPSSVCWSRGSNNSLHPRVDAAQACFNRSVRLISREIDIICKLQNGITPVKHYSDAISTKAARH